MGKVFKSSKNFPVPAALIDLVLSFHDLLLVFAGLNAPEKKDNFHHQIDKYVSFRVRPFTPFAHIFSCLCLKNWLRLLKLIQVIFFISDK